MTSYNDVKSEEDAGTDGVLVVKISPRQYATPTVPTTTLQGAISLSVRGDVDFNGSTYIDVVSRIMGEMEKLQKCYCRTHDEYSIPDEGFTVTGFQLNQGDNTVNPTNKIYNFTTSFTVFGVISEENW